jgi:hypothetical protein
MFRHIQCTIRRVPTSRTTKMKRRSDSDEEIACEHGTGMMATIALHWWNVQ